MDIKEAIKQRHSVRQYKVLPLEDAAKKKLSALVKECNVQSGLNIQLVCDDSECFNTFLAHYGKFKNANNYFAMLGKKSMENLDELVGYYGQKLVLEKCKSWYTASIGTSSVDSSIISGQEQKYLSSRIVSVYGT